MSAEEIEAKVRAYLAEHPELNHPGKLTGAMKKELGDTAVGKALNEICKRVLGASRGSFRKNGRAGARTDLVALGSLALGCARVP